MKIINIKRSKTMLKQLLKKPWKNYGEIITGNGNTEIVNTEYKVSHEKYKDKDNKR